MSIGHKIIDEIIKQNMVVADRENPDVLIWAGNAPEQLEAFVCSQPPPPPPVPDRPVWPCEHIQMEKPHGWDKKVWCYHHVILSSAWNMCPICGATRPTGASVPPTKGKQ